MRALLRLIRLPNTLSAVGDVLAGAALAGVELEDPRLWLAAVGSGLLYAGGIALNDLVDREEDAVHHPTRPLPAKEVLPSTALRVGLIACGLGLLSSATGSTTHILVSVGLLLSIVVYDLLPTRLDALGAPMMGLCRALNLARGMTLGVALSGMAEVAICAHFLLIFLITWISSFEERGVRSTVLRLFLSALALCYLLPAAAVWREGGTTFPMLAILGAALAVAVTLPGFGPRPRPGLIVFRGVFTLVLVDALWALAAGRSEIALILALFLPGMRWIKEAIAQRGS